MAHNGRPPGKTWESYAEFMMRKAKEEGAFEHLPGTGKPIPGLDEPYHEDWWLRGFLKREGLSLLPDALALKAELSREVERLWRIPDECDVRRRIEELNEKIRRANARCMEGPSLNLHVFDLEVIVQQWRKIRLNPGRRFFERQSS